MDTENGESEEKLSNLTKSQKCTLVTFYVSAVIMNIFYSLIGPFFPEQAAAKGLDAFEIGLVFSVCEFVMLCVSPIMGANMSKVGAKQLYLGGLVSASTASAAFGFIEYCPGGPLFIVLCLSLRTIEAIGSAAVETASFAILANTFPDKLATVIGYLELFISLGLMLGPPVGGLLYKAGGFKAPFLVTAILNLSIALLCSSWVPSQDSVKKLSKPKTSHMLRIPVVLLMLIAIFISMMMDTFILFALGLRLNYLYSFEPAIIGGIYLLGPGLYAISCPLWGYVADKLPNCSIVFMLLGSILIGLGFLFMGPTPFIHITQGPLWLLLVCVALVMIGMGPFVNSYQVMATAAVDSGLPEDMGTFGLVSGLFSTASNLGCFVGPLLGGYLLNTIHFEWTTFVFACFGFAFTALTLVYLCVTSSHFKVTSQSTDNIPLVTEKTSLVKDGGFMEAKFDADN